MKKKIIKRTPPKENTLLPYYPAVLQRIYSSRGIESNTDLEYGLEKLLPYHTFLGINEAVACLFNALKNQKNILIVGDFDVDGATSTAVAIRALRSFGAKRINFLVPNRFAFGYGLTPELVQVAAEDFKPDLIITVDNGIASHAGVLAAKTLGIQVIITDHHLAAETLPVADAIVNPNQANDFFPSKSIAGVGVIFYVMLALRRYLSDCGWFTQQNIPEPNMSHLLDLVALGTVADVVPLDHNNRLLVHQGLRRIRAGRCVPAIIALLELGGRDLKRVVATDLGFVVAPRLNAAGRLDDMSLGIESLLCDDLARARERVKVLDELNKERRVIEQDMQEQALRFLHNIPLDQKKLSRGICLFDPAWHQGVIGILAARIKDRFHRPVIAFALANDTELKGSARSIPGVHIRDVLAHIDMKYPRLIEKFGGHAMAAGLTLSRASFADFSRIFNDVVSTQLPEEDLQHIILSDGELNSSELTVETAEILREAGPWGQAFPEPLFEGVFQVLEQRLVAGKHLKMILSKENIIIDAIAFNIDSTEWPNHRCVHINIAYRMDINEFQNKRKVQFIVEHLETA
ncbi:MAG: recJ [Gammaproteobacteria bacterium]|nr:recJ [Gammaproteobacteria bacterium]